MATARQHSIHLESTLYYHVVSTMRTKKFSLRGRSHHWKEFRSSETMVGGPNKNLGGHF